MEILRLHINVTEVNKVEAGNTTVQMVMFDGTCDGEFFVGRIMNGGVDTQVYTPNGGTLSARYMLEGLDSAGLECRMFIENNGDVVEGEETKTTPKIYTDSAALKWLETEPLTGRVTDQDGQLVIIINS